MRLRIFSSLILLTTGFLSAQSLTGTITTTEGDVDKPVRVIAKRGDLIAMDSTFLLGETYTADWSTVGVDKFAYQLPQPKLLGIANSVSSDGNVYPIVSGDPGLVSYRVYDIQGRELRSMSNIPAGKYFLQLMNKSNGDLLGVQSFVLLNHQLNVQFKSNTATSRLSKPAEDGDSLIVIYEADDMVLEPYREAVIAPASGVTQLDIELVRNRRGPLIYFYNEPESPTIDTTYLITIDAIAPDYDDQIADVDVFHLFGDSIQYEFNDIDSLRVSPHTRGDHEFHVLVNTLFSHRGRNIELGVESHSHVVQTLDFFGNLGGPYPDLEVWLRGKLQMTDENGVAMIEVSTTAGALSIIDSVEVYHPTNDTTFYAMQLPVDTAVDTQKVQTYTDRNGPSYWAGWPWVHQWNREAYTAAMNLNPDFQFIKFGNIEDDQADTIFVYCPDFISGPEGHPLRMYYRPVIADEIDNLNQKLGNRAGPGRQSKVHFQLLENTVADSMLADSAGILLHFEGTHNHTENAYEMDASQDLLYITATDAYIHNAIGNDNIQRLINLFYHEAIHHGTGLLVHSPYNHGNPGNQENMSSALYPIQEHELDGLFTRYHFEPSHIRNFQGYETFHQDQLE
jgi:hypothetical protein